MQIGTIFILLLLLLLFRTRFTFLFLFFPPLLSPFPCLCPPPSLFHLPQPPHSLSPTASNAATLTIDPPSINRRGQSSTAAEGQRIDTLIAQAMGKFNDCEQRIKAQKQQQAAQQSLHSAPNKPVPKPPPPSNKSHGAASSSPPSHQAASRQMSPTPTSGAHTKGSWMPFRSAPKPGAEPVHAKTVASGAAGAASTTSNPISGKKPSP